MLLTACASETPGAASDEQDTLLGTEEASCATPNTGCACANVGETVDCGKIQLQVGDDVQCMMGSRTCLPTGTWGDCGGDTSIRTVKTGTLSAKTLGTTGAICAKNACDPYCKEFSDTPQGLDAGAGFRVNDAGMTLAPTGTFTLVTCTGITVTPKTSTTMVIDTLNPDADDKLEFTAALTPAGCYPGTAEPIWTITDTRADSLVMTSSGATGTLTAISAIAGPVTVRAHIGALVGQINVNVNVDINQVDTGSTAYASSFPLTTGAAETASVLYPYEATVFPLGLPPPIPQWTAPTAANAVKLSLRWVSGSTYFKWSVITTENKALTIVPNTAVALAAAPRYPDIPALAWFDFEQSAKGQNVEIALQRIVGTTTRNAEIKKTIKFANSQLRGNVYYQSYGTRLTYNYAGAKDSTGGVTFPSGKFGAATLGIEPGASTPRVIAGQSVSDTSGTNCRVCHTASADGSTLITQKFGGSNGSSVMLTNLTNASPTNTNMTAKSDGTYAWPAIFPTGGFLFGNAGVSASYGSGPPPGGLDGSNPNITSSFWSLSTSSLGAAKSATYKTGGATSTTFNIPSSSWGLQAGVPVFSATGSKIAMQHHAGKVCAVGTTANCSAEELKTGDKRSLAIMDWNNTTNQASNFRVLVTEPNTACSSLHPDGTCTDVWPTFLPNDTGLVYEREIMNNGHIGGGLADFAGTRSGCDNSGVCNNDGTKAEIWWTNVTGTSQPTRLNAANGRDSGGASYLPTGANASSYCTVSGFYCTSNSQCCSNSCSNNRCTGVGYTPLKVAGASCTFGSECESGQCLTSLLRCACNKHSDCQTGSQCQSLLGTGLLAACSGNKYAGIPSMSYVPGHNTTVEPVLNYEPTVNPTATKAANGTTDEFYWVVFTSRRQFGNIATQNPWWSDPRHQDLSKSVSTKKLWVTAVSANPTAGTDPSFPAFYLPGQEWVSGNSKAYWVQNACKPGSTTKSAANVCDTTQDCCAGSTCKLDAPVTSPATRHCVPTNVCAPAGNSCSTSSDCCSGYLCSNGSCTDVPPIPSYGASATFKRDFTNTCVQGFRAKWGTFEYQGTFPTGTSMTVKVRVANDDASLETATPLATVGTANTTTTGWAFLPTPAQNIDQILVANGAPLARPKLRVEMTLTPSANSTAAPTITNWRVNMSCVPAE